MLFIRRGVNTEVKFCLQKNYLENKDTKQANTKSQVRHGGTSL